MIIKKDIYLNEFEAWQGATLTKDIIISEGKAKEFEELIDELFEDGLTETELNDFLWFDSDYIFEVLGLTDYLDD